MKCLKVALPILLMLVSGSAMAVPGGRIFLQTPEDRAQDWQDNFFKFLADHPELRSEKVQALEDLAQINDLSFFLESPRKDRRDFLAARMTELGRVLSFSEYQELMGTASRELANWMKATGVDPATPECNCSNTADCNGAACRSITCEHVAGTSHNGRC